MILAGMRRRRQRELELHPAGAFDEHPKRRRGPWLTPQVHAGVTLALSMFGFLGGGACGMVLVFAIGERLNGSPLCVLIPILLFGGALVGMWLPAQLWVETIAARCLRCGGRAFRQDTKKDRIDRTENARYRCRDCEHVEELGFRGGIGGGSSA